MKRKLPFQISEDYLNEHVNQSSVFGPPGQVFLYEWSKYRYGVFEEHGYPGDPLYPMFYSKQIFTAQGSRNVVKPNLCTNVEPSGTMETVNGEDCEINSENGMPSDDCIFVVDGPSSIESSVMAVPYLDGNDQWCDFTEERLHNSEITTKHNTMCEGLSVFEVVRQSPDFIDYKPLNSTVTEPKFTIIQPRGSSEPFTFLLDYSGSMFDNNRRDPMVQGVKRFLEIDVDLEKSLPIGVAEFSNDASIVYQITPIMDEATREEIITAVDRIPKGGGTCLHIGVRESLKALKNYIPTGGMVIFMTDGDQACDGVDNWIGEIIDEVLRQKVRFCTIALSNAADQDLESLAQR